MRSMLLASSALHAPDLETGSQDADVGADVGGGAPPPVPLNERPADGPGSGRSALRKDLEKNMATDRKGREAAAVAEAKAPPKKARGINHQDAEPEPEVVEGAGADGQPVEGAEGEGQEAVEALAPPKGISKEAAAEWANAPRAVQEAFIKREEQMAQGVQALQQRYADIDGAIAPRLETIRKHGHTPGQAVNQLFAWFELLSANPQQGFPALAESFRFDLRKLVQPQQAQPGAQPGAEGGQPEGAISPAVQSYIDGLTQQVQQLNDVVTQRFGTLENTFAQQSQAKSQEILDNWSKGKPHFEEVRQAMAQILQAGIVPPLANGGADLDAVYDRAIYMMPEIRAKVLADQRKAEQAELKKKQDAERKAQQDQAIAARRAQGGSLGLGAPGNPVDGAGAPKKGKGKSVRESINQAREELSS